MNKKNINHKYDINLPKINFPMKANLNIKEPQIIKKWEEKNIYKKIKNNKKKKNKFIIHDGPPYANGEIHIGHAFNKILKDIILKYKNLMNYNIQYIPGWDCHGLPIELEIQKKTNFKNKINEFKKKCFKYANIQINKQKKDFIRLGILADWKNYYKTMNTTTIINTIEVFKKILKLNLIKYKNKPINWCINCKSSLSDAEIEYFKKKSKSIYVCFTIKNIKKYNIFKEIKNKKINLIIWTTTPWTIPGNCAISIHPDYLYSIIKFNKKIYIIIKNNIKNIFNKKKIKIIKEINGKKLNNILVNHPISNKKIPIILNKKIKINTGTGIVHIASEHGEEDYLISKKNKLKGINVINEKGNYIKYDFIKKIYNCNIYESEKIIIEELKKKNKIILEKKIIHKYPHCWRHKTPIIIRSTPQLFIKIDKKLKKKILKSIKNVKWNPSWGYKKIKEMIIKRPDWCISRQRKWGTPIILFINKKNKKIHPNSINIINKIIKKIKKNGTNYWFNTSTKKILKKKYNKYHKITDILDIWFDSGATCFSIINPKFKKKNISDLYLEGSDQYRGWFMSSLIINVAINNCAPFKQIISHGFIVDKNGKKMSKSLKNTINPKNIINKFGADILRLWVASTKFNKEIHISNEIILRTVELYRKIRNTIKFLVSNLDEFNPKKKIIKKKQMLLIDKWIIHKTKKTQNKIINLFNKFKFNKIIKKINIFCTKYLSSLYIDIIKDRKYTIKKNTIPYYSVQITIWMILESITKWITPIISFTAEEIWNYLPRKKDKNLYNETWFNKLFFLHKNNKINEKIWEKLILIKNKLNKIIEKKKINKKINSSLETEIILYTKKSFFEKIKKIKKELKYFFLTSKTKLKKFKKKYEKNFFKIICKKIKGIKCNRCWHYVKKNKFKNKNICNRCIKNTIGSGEKRKFI